MRRRSDQVASTRPGRSSCKSPARRASGSREEGLSTRKGRAKHMAGRHETTVTRMEVADGEEPAQPSWQDRSALQGHAGSQQPDITSGVNTTRSSDLDSARDLTRAFVASVGGSGGATPIDLSGLMRVSDEGVSRRPDGATGWGYWLLDVTVTEDDSLALLEANGSNGAGNSIVNGGLERINHIVSKMIQSDMTALQGTVAVLPHGKRFHHIPEFLTRATQLCMALRREGVDAEFVYPGSSPSPDHVSVVVGDIVTIASNLYCDAKVRYQGAPVSFIQNGTILPELVRQGKCEKVESLDLTVFHESRSVLIANNKSLQQDLCHDTGFRPLRWIEGDDVPSFISKVEGMLETLEIVAIKPNVGSQGIGVDFVGRGEFVKARVQAQVATLRRDYGSNADLTSFPLRAFEWVKSKPINHPDKSSRGKHLWDLRVEVLVSPHQIRAVPLIARVCPAAYRLDHPYNPAALKSNLSGREPSTDNLITPATLWHRLGFDYSDRILEAAASWAEKASPPEN